MADQLWTSEEQATLRSLRIDPFKTRRAKLTALVEHFLQGGTVYAVSPSASRELSVSLAFARKVRNWTQEGRLTWLVPGEHSLKAALRIRLGTPHVGFWTNGLSTAQFATVDVVNESGSEATDCWAWVELLQTGVSVPLHYAGASVDVSAADSPRIRISPRKPARLELAFAVPPYGGAPPANLQRVALTGSVPMHMGLPQAPRWNGEGCWLAEPIALDNPDPRLESYLPPGEHRLNVSVGCGNCGGDTAEYILTSLSSWLDLEIRLA